MRPWQSALSLVPVVAWVILAGACSDDVVSVGLAMRSTQGLLDDATEVTLRVIDDGAAKCRSSSGHLEGTPAEDAVQTFSLVQTGCEPGAAWCKTVTLDRDDTTKIFSVTATGPGGLIAEGCTKAVIDQDPLEVEIQLHKVNAPKCCGDGVLQAFEQCDNGPTNPGCPGDVGLAGCTGTAADDVCDCDCVSREILLSIDNPVGTPALSNGPAGTKFDPAIVFSGNVGPDTAGALRAVYVDTEGTSAPDLNLRMLTNNLHAFPTEPYDRQLRLPRCDNPRSSSAPALTQHQPASASMTGNRVGVVYASDQAQQTVFRIYLNVQNEWGCTDGDPMVVNVQLATSCEGPDIARGAEGTALIVWTDGGQVRARMWVNDNTLLGALQPSTGDIPLSQATGGTARVAGSAATWIVAYESGGDVFIQTVSPGGVPGIAEQVNALADGSQDQPDVAALPDGRFIVVWHSADLIYMQRYDADGERVAGDQDRPINLASPPGWQPVVAGTDSSGGAFAAAWTAVDGTIWARFLGGSRSFAYNKVNGESSEFMASHPAVLGQRSEPAVAIGGGGWVAIAWQDLAPDHPGIYVRRFPLPD